jgi:hypothetical protein
VASTFLFLSAPTFVKNEEEKKKKRSESVGVGCGVRMVKRPTKKAERAPERERDPFLYPRKDSANAKRTPNSRCKSDGRAIFFFF